MTDHIRDEHSSDSARISDPAHYHTATRLEHDLLGDREVPSSALYEIVCDRGLMTREELDRVLNPDTMTHPQQGSGTLPV